MSEHACPMCGYRPRSVGPDEASLPMRYRKAYRFMLANLAEPDLTVSDLAQAAGVSDRAIQLMWKKCLGCAPSATVRRLRAEKIRYEIITTNKTVMRCAEKFGVFDRGTLSGLFRAVFGVSPGSLRGPELPHGGASVARKEAA